MNALWHVIRVVWFKEALDSLRDRRSLLSSLLMGPLLGPILFGLLMSYMLSVELEQAQATLEVPVQGAEHAPALAEWLAARDILLQPVDANTDLAGQIRNHKHKLALRIPEDYPGQLAAGQPATVQLYYDSTQQKTRSQRRRLEQAIERYGQTVAAQRLVLRGLHPQLIQPLRVELRDQAPKGADAARLLAMLPYFFIMAVFVGGMHVAMDATAGERERNSLEPLFTLPVPRWALMLGKILAASQFALFSLLLNMLAFWISLRFIPLEAMDLKLAWTPAGAAMILLAMLPMPLLASSLQTLIAAQAKSFREAQTYVSLLMFLPIVPSLILMIAPVDSADWMYWVPILGQNLIINEAVRGETITLPHLFSAVLGSLLAAMLAAGVAAGVYTREKLALAS